MKTTYHAVLFCTLFLVGSFSCAYAKEPPKPIFNGSNTDGWTNPYDHGTVEVKNGVLQLQGDKKFFLVSEKTYDDFQLWVDVKVHEGGTNSGIQFRSMVANQQVVGYQAEVDPSDRSWSGGLYDEGRRGWLQTLENKPEAQKAFKLGEWNTYRIRCVGNHIQIWVNGTKTTDSYDPVDLNGHIALQHHGDKGKAFFRNIRINNLGKHRWEPIFNGKNFDGWHKSEGDWKIEDEVIIGSAPKSLKQYGHLVSDETYDDFTVQFDFKVNSGNSGFYFRSEEVDARAGMHGIQAEVEKAGEVGGLYQTAGRGWIFKPPENRVKEAYIENGWNQMTVSAYGNRIVVHLNAQKMADIMDEESRKKGRLALQLHAGMNMDVRFRRIRMLRPK